jgi:hypothetical protein
MKSATRTTVIAGAVLASSLAASVFFAQKVSAARPQAALDDVLFISSPSMVKRMSLGYYGLMADIYWTRAVQYFGGRRHAEARSYTSLYPLLAITTTLDPKLMVAYQFGANFLSAPPPQGAGMPEKALQLVDYGIQHNPTAWKLYYEKGFIYYMEMKDYVKAAQAFDDGSKLPDAHPFLRVLAANMAQHGGDVEMARALWTTTYETTQDKNIRGNAIAHLRALRVDEDVTHIQEAVTAYGTRTGSLPPSMGAMVSAGLLPGLPVDPDGHAYKLASDGRVLVANPEDFPFIAKGLTPGYQPLPPKNFDNLVK